MIIRVWPCHFSLCFSSQCLPFGLVLIFCPFFPSSSITFLSCFLSLWGWWPTTLHYLWVQWHWILMISFFLADVSKNGFCAFDSDFIGSLRTPDPAVPGCTYISGDRHLFLVWLFGGRKVYAALVSCFSSLLHLFFSSQQGLLLLLTAGFLHSRPGAHACTHVSYSSIIVSIPLFFCSELSVEFVSVRLQWRTHCRFVWWSSHIDRCLAKLLNMALPSFHHHSSLAQPSSHHISQFLWCLNPAVEAR